MLGWPFNLTIPSGAKASSGRSGERRALTNQIRLKLHGLNPDAVYVLTNLDTAKETKVSGRELSEKGLSVVLTDQPGSAVIAYKTVSGK